MPQAPTVGNPIGCPIRAPWWLECPKDGWISSLAHQAAVDRLHVSCSLSPKTVRPGKLWPPQPPHNTGKDQDGSDWQRTLCGCQDNAFERAWPPSPGLPSVVLEALLWLRANAMILTLCFPVTELSLETYRELYYIGNFIQVRKFIIH